VSGEIRLKGSVLWGVIQALERVMGWDGREQIVSMLTDELGEGVRTRSIIATGWYPIAWHRQLLAGIVRHGGQTALREAVRISTRDNVGTIHRILVRMISRDALLRQGDRVFSSFFEARTKSTRESPTLSRIEWFDCRGFDANVWQAQRETVAELLTMAGSKVRRSRVVSGGADEDDSMVLELDF
jgi:hypothetical protein